MKERIGSSSKILEASGFNLQSVEPEVVVVFVDAIEGNVFPFDFNVWSADNWLAFKAIDVLFDSKFFTFWSVL